MILGEKGLGSLLKGVIQVCFYIGIIFLISLPFILNIFGVNLNASAVVIYPNGICLLVIMYQFIGLFDSLKINNPFCKNTIKRLKTARNASSILAILWLLDLLFEVFLARSFDIFSIVVLCFMIALFFGVAIALHILSELFEQAVEYKTENELTI